MTPFNSGPLILLSAVRDKDVKRVQELLDKQSLKVDDEWSDYIILIQALQVGSIEIVQLLLTHGCRVKGPKTDVFFTPLYYAVDKYQGNSLDLLKILLNAGASIVDKDKNIVTPLYLAFSKDKLEIVDLLLSMYDTENINPLNQDEIIHFHIACIRGNANLIEYFIRKGININDIVDSSTCALQRCTPLHTAVTYKKIEIVKMLLEFGADCTVQDFCKRTALHAAYYMYMHSNLHKNSTYSYNPADHKKIDETGRELINLILQAHATNGSNAIDLHGISHFHIACANNDVALVKNFLDNRVDVNCGISRDCKLSDIVLPIHLAIKYNHLEIVKILLQHKALDSMKIELLNSLLYLAVEYNHIEILELLIEHGMDSVVAQNTESLHLAVNKKCKEVVEILLNHNAEVDAKDEKGITPLQLAVEHGFYEIVEVLLKFKANVCVQDEKKCTPIHTAFQKLSKSSKCLNMMLSIHSGLMENIINKKRLSIFHIACSQGNSDIIKNFLKSDVDVNACTKVEKYVREKPMEYTALHFAALEHNLDVVKLLLDHGAQIDATEYTGSTPLFLVFESWPLCPVIEKLILDEFGDNLDVNAVKENSDRIIESVSKISRNTEVIQLLLERKSNLNHRNKAGQSLLFKIYEKNVLRTPEVGISSMCSRILHKSMESHNKTWSIFSKIKSKIFADIYKKVMSILIDQEIDFNAQDKDGNSLLHHMSEHHLHDCVCENVSAIAEMILDKGANPHLRNKQGETPFHLAVSNGCLELVRLLLKFNVQTDCRDTKLRTPMHVAMYHSCEYEDANIRHLKVVQLLVDGARDVDIRDGEKQTPLFRAVQCSKSGDGTRYLLEANCNVNASDENGETPIFIATIKCNFTGVQMLLDYGADINVFNNQHMSLMRMFFERYDRKGTKPGMYLALKALAAHMRKLLVIGYPVSRCNLEHCIKLENAYDDHGRSRNNNKGNINLEMLERDKKLVSELKKELEEMKNVRIDVYTTLYDLLMKNAQKMSKHVKNEDFKKYLFDEKKKTEFPHCHSILHAKFRGGVARRVLLKSAGASLGFFMRNNVPASCADHIFNHLSDQDLKSLIHFRAMYAS